MMETMMDVSCKAFCNNSELMGRAPLADFAPLPHDNRRIARCIGFAQLLATAAQGEAENG